MRSAYFGLAAAAFCLSSVAASGGDDVVGHKLLPKAMDGRDLSNNNNSEDLSRRHLAKLEMRQDGQTCGPQAGKCGGNLCCSSYGFCGDSIDHCNPLFDCQPDYGICGWPRPAATPTTTSKPPPPPTSTSTTSTTKSSTTSTSTTPTSTSTTSTTSIYTPPPSSSTTSTSSAPPTSSTPIPGGGMTVTTNGMCGNNTVCIGSAQYGPCCSQFFWCGSTLDFCGAGCQGAFGACFGSGGSSSSSTTTTSTSSIIIPPPSSSTTSTTSTTSIYTPPPITTTSTTSTTSSIKTTSTTSSAQPTSSVTIPPGFKSSTDGTCGPGVTCLGSNYGKCCSQFGWCGDGDQFCPYIVGCQPDYGYCDPQPSFRVRDLEE
ncbi:hypothetical protein B0T19DRAFT_80427 [Cercophora scortea]|uniref:Chitin-binding type-1 domain-containing protein n=1 Tax=Cercophora scortea TaxID=314031 RepID=A0AAE0MNK1_9PEZI|nr:hypothetical protein B0T19DRAFT_80427 [Cercophora scortea]